MTTPTSLACVLVTDTYATLRPMVARLLSQPGPHRLELIVVANRVGLAGIDAPELRAFGRVHGIELESTVQMHVARAVGVRATLSPLVFIGETHCFPCEGWLEATLKAFDGPCSILLPSVTNGCPRGLFGWAGYIMDYSRRRPEQPPEKFTGGIGYNAVYRTRLLLALGDRLDAALNHHEERLFTDLHSQQPRILFEPAARLCHVGVTLFIPSLQERLFVGLILGDSRARRWPIHRRLHLVRPGHDPSYRRALDGFADALLGKPDGGADATDGWASLAAVLAAERSAESGHRIPVLLS
jgi:hypothetical protein